jgi:ribokinase
MIVVFGSINLDLIFALPHLPQAGETVLCPGARAEPGGKGANQAVAAARDGAAVVMVGAVGRDALAEGTLPLLRQAGVDLSRVVVTPEAGTACAAVQVDHAGHNAIAVGSGANLLTRSAQVEDALLIPATTLLLQMEVDPAETAALIARAHGRVGRIILNLAPAAALPRAALSAVDILTVNETEAGWLAAHLGVADDAASLRRALGVDIIRTLGADGLEAATTAGVSLMPARAIAPVDTTAAGDCFVGVLAAALDRGDTLTAALGRATAAAALCCTRPGSQASLPWAAETDGFI